MLSQTAEYALRAVIYLGCQSDSPRTTQEIAEAMDAPAYYLAKVMQMLARAGVVQAQRGRKGGFTLAKSAKALTMLTVVNAVDPIRRMEQCPLGIQGNTGCLCPLHRRLDEAMGCLEYVLGSTRFDDLVAQTLAEGLMVNHTPALSVKE